MGKESLRAFFFRSKTVNVLIALDNPKKEWFASSLAKEADCTFPHIIKILSKFESFGLVSFTVEGRRKLVFLTLKGKRLSEDFSRTIAAFKD